MQFRNQGKLVDGKGKYVKDPVSMKRTFGVPKSVLRYVLDKGQYFDQEISFTQYFTKFVLSWIDCVA